MTLPPMEPPPPEPPDGDDGRLARWVWGHLWVFIVLGVLQIVLAFLMVVVYFSIRTITSSLELVETIPSYAPALLVICTGVIDMFLSRRNDILLLVLALLLNMVSCILCLCSVLLTGLLSLATMEQYHTCLYSTLHVACTCFTDDGHQAQHGEMMLLSPPSNDNRSSSQFVYESAASCTVIEQSLKDYMYSLLSLHSMVSVLCMAGSVLTGAIFKAEKDRQGLFEHSQLESGAADMTLPRQSGSHPADSRYSGGLFSRNISLPGHSLVAQQLGLPGDDPARLITVRRMASECGMDSPACTSPSPPVMSPRVTSPLYSTPPNSQHELEQLHVSQLQHWWGRYLEECWQQQEHQQADQRGVFQSPEPANVTNRPPLRRPCSHSDIESAVAAARTHQRGARRRQRRHQRHLRQLRALARQGHLAAYQALHHEHPPPPPPPPPAPFDRNFYPLSFLQFMSGVTNVGCGSSEPPPPYMPVLPPYLEFDPAPSYRSREASSLGSQDETDNTEVTFSTSAAS